MQKKPTSPTKSKVTASPPMTTGKTTPPAASASKPQGKSSGGFLQGCLGCLGVSVVLLIAFVVVVNVFSNEEHDQPAASPQLTQSAVSQETKPANGAEQKVRSTVVGVVGTKNNLGGERIVSLQVNDHAGTAKADDKIVVTTLLADDAGGSTKSRIQYQSIDMFKKLFAMSEIEEVTTIWQFPLVDTYGKAETKPVMKITIDKATATKINWDNFNRENFSKVANAYYEHTALRNDK